MKTRIALNNPNTYIILLVDAILLFFAYLSAYWLRFETISPTPEVNEFFWRSVFVVIALKLVIFTYYGLQSGMWRYTGIVDLLNIIKATIVSFVLIMVAAVFFYYSNLTGTVSRSVFLIDAIMTMILISAFRLGIRLYYSRGMGAKGFLDAFRPARARESSGGIPVVIFGANERGELLLRSLTGRMERSNYEPVGFIDDNRKYSGVHIHGYPVLGSLDNFEEIASRFSVRELLVASKLPGEELERINELCRGLNVVCRIVPAYLDTSDLRIDVSQLRNIQVEDLLNRQPVQIGYLEIESSIRGSRVLITGAGGSIGSQLALHIAEFEPAQIIMVDKCENYLYELGISQEKNSHKSTRFDYKCVDITNEDRMDRLMAAAKPQYVFHAAAHKHVPLMENNKEEAIRNNIGGVKVMATLSEKYGVKRFILISTDKAVNPVNTMGITKRVCELYVQNLSKRSRTIFMSVRFGNVLGSNGSVIPLFMKQIESRGPVTVTDENVERYFMTIPEAVLLILQAATFGDQGALYLLDMGEPVKIMDLARTMIRMAGFEPEKDIAIKITGLRPGEKLHEELTGAGEVLLATDHPKINSVNNRNPVWKGTDDLVEFALKKCTEDPEAAQQAILAWLKKGEGDLEPERGSAAHLNVMSENQKPA